MVMVLRTSHGSSTAAATGNANAAARTVARRLHPRRSMSAHTANGSTAIPAAVSFAPTAAPSARPTAMPARPGPDASWLTHASMAVARRSTTAMSLYARLPVTITHGIPSIPHAATARVHRRARSGSSGASRLAASTPVTSDAATAIPACIHCVAPAIASIGANDVMVHTWSVAPSTKPGNVEYTLSRSGMMRPASNHSFGSCRW